MKKHWLKSFVVAAAVATASANASADVVAAVAANGHHWLLDAPLPVAGMTTAAFSHPGGQLVAIYSAECSAAAPHPAYSDRAVVDVDIMVQNMQGYYVATLSPSGQSSAFCSSVGSPGVFSSPGTFSTTGVATLSAGTYRVVVRGRLNEERASGWMGARSLIVMR